MCHFTSNDFKHNIPRFYRFYLKYEIKTLSSIMIAYNNLECTIYFHCIAEINCIDYCIDQFIPICRYIRKDLKPITTS